MRCLQLCVTKFSEWEETNADYREVPAVTEAQDILQSLVERMGKCEPEDFELDKSSDFTATSSVGQKNKGFAKILMGVYEVGINRLSSLYVMEVCYSLTTGSIGIHICYWRI